MARLPAAPMPTKGLAAWPKAVLFQTESDFSFFPSLREPSVASQIRLEDNLVTPAGHFPQRVLFR